MATETAPLPAPTRLWQVPIFFVGCLTAAIMYFFHPLIVQCSPHNPEHILANARTALAAKPADTEMAITLAGKVIERSELPPVLLGEAHYLTGCAYLEKNDAEAMTQARHHFESADVHGVPDALRNKLSIHLAKVWLETNADPQPTIRALVKIADTSESPFEVFGLLVEAHQRANPIDQAGLIEALRQQLAHAPSAIEPAKIAPVRLHLAKLLLDANNTKEARIVLRRFGADTPSDILFQANTLLAKCEEDSKDWPAAAKAWEALKNDSKLPSAERVRVLYRLGWAQFQSQMLPDATAHLQAAASQGGPWGHAAALRLAQIQTNTDPKAATAALAEALNSVARPEDYQSAAIPLDELRTIFEDTCEALKKKGDFATAIDWTVNYTRICVPGRAAELRGQLAASWAETLTAANNPEAVTRWVESARAFLASAADASPGPVAVYRLWSAAQAAGQGHDYRVALEALTQLVPLHAHATSAQVAEAWYTTGQVYENLNDPNSAKSSYQRCLTMEAPWKFRARYQLAQIELVDARADDAWRNKKDVEEAVRIQHELAARVKFDDAEKLLQENLNELRQAVQPDSAVQELTVYGLADIAYERQEYAAAEPRLKGALQEYPQSPLAVRGHYRLALCTWKRATDDFKALSSLGADSPQRERLQKQYLDSIAAAIEQYTAVETSLLQKPSPAADEAEMLKRAGFGLAELNYFAGKYAEAAAKYDALAKRYEGKVEGLHAIHQLWNCQYNTLNQKDQAVEQMARLQAALDKTPATEFNGSTDMHSRPYWENKIVEMAKTK